MVMSKKELDLSIMDIDDKIRILKDHNNFLHRNPAKFPLLTLVSGVGLWMATINYAPQFVRHSTISQKQKEISTHQANIQSYNEYAKRLHTDSMLSTEQNEKGYLVSVSIKDQVINEQKEIVKIKQVPDSMPNRAYSLTTLGLFIASGCGLYWLVQNKDKRLSNDKSQLLIDLKENHQLNIYTDTSNNEISSILSKKEFNKALLPD
jgi:uncharacterized protein YxeA